MKTTWTVPAVLGIVVLGGCAPSNNTDASVSDIVVSDATDDRNPTCVPLPGADGSIELTYLDGATVGYGRFFGDGASLLWVPDGAVVGTFETDQEGWFRMGGPCGRLA